MCKEVIPGPVSSLIEDLNRIKRIIVFQHQQIIRVLCLRVTQVSAHGQRLGGQPDKLNLQAPVFSFLRISDLVLAGTSSLIENFYAVLVVVVGVIVNGGIQLQLAVQQRRLVTHFESGDLLLVISQRYDSC